MMTALGAKALTTEELLEQQQGLARDLRTVNRELSARDFLTSDMQQRSTFIQAKMYFDHLVSDENLSPGDMGSVVHWFKFLVEKDVHRRALASAQIEREVEVRQRMEELKNATPEREVLRDSGVMQ